ncbi:MULTISPECIES: biliverdin-producing heme oxygenase [unclassified Sphingomonas]|uniref:biliverdin-producing heme oxygenase n=1 Tax=unclassified Sphingomonas TaxID=196159 RepID=UPI0022699C76|nr:MULTISPECIES: biliverdin-producing heme oxygenase [unclassified Sphingomonas]
MTAVQKLRASTAPDHDIVDAAFGGFDLADRRDYTAFLIAHARALPAVEAALAGIAGLPATPARTALLADDLAALGVPMPPPLPFAIGPAAAWGALYVAEGSRLGGIMLAGRVGQGLPAAYLSARHGTGAWRVLLAAIDAAVLREDAIAAAVAGARATFALYAAAAGVAPDDGTTRPGR